MPNLFMFPVVDDARLRFTRRKFNCLVQQNFVINDSFVLNAAVGADNHLWLRHKNSPVIVTIVEWTTHFTTLLIPLKREFT